MQPVYKRVKHSAPHCPQCHERLAGNNSIASPWRCSCGTWKSVMDYDEVGGYSQHYEIEK